MRALSRPGDARVGTLHADAMARPFALGSIPRDELAWLPAGNADVFVGSVRVRDLRAALYWSKSGWRWSYARRGHDLYSRRVG
jgi:hypothetical protein